MTEQEIIKALKENEKAFCFWPPALKDWAIEHRVDMQRLLSTDGWTNCCDVSSTSSTYHLRPDYPDLTERKVK